MHAMHVCMHGVRACVGVHASRASGSKQTMRVYIRVRFACVVRYPTTDRIFQRNATKKQEVGPIAMQKRGKHDYPKVCCLAVYLGLQAADVRCCKEGAVYIYLAGRQDGANTSMLETKVKLQAANGAGAAAVIFLSQATSLCQVCCQ